MSYTDWLGGLDLIPDKRNKTILELGLGEGTKHLLDNFAEVYSFEVYKTKEWYDKCVEDYDKHYDNWRTKFIHFTELGMDVSEKKLLDSGGQNRSAVVFAQYIYELTKFVNVSPLTFDVVFVDQGFHQRGESVEFFLRMGMPIVMCHDYKTGHELYGWRFIESHPEYDSHLYNSHLGLNIWTKR